jgi:hypothetical protein
MVRRRKQNLILYDFLGENTLTITNSIAINSCLQYEGALVNPEPWIICPPVWINAINLRLFEE